MDKKELQSIIKKLESSNSEDEAYSEFKHTDDKKKNNLFLRTTTTGLRLLAAELLRISIDVDKEDNNRLTRIPFNRTKWMHGLLVQYVQPWKKRPIDEQKETWNEEDINTPDSVPAPWGCQTIIILIVVLAILGAVALFKWVF